MTTVLLVKLGISNLSVSTTDIRYISGSDDAVGDTFSRISEIGLINFNNLCGLAQDQFSYQELQSLMGSRTTRLELRPMYFASYEKLFYYPWALCSGCHETLPSTSFQ
ncbi:hypothetical protein AVEN_244894-1 [Araneus ventricosus]|uniref:Uncharacterized protein n=1 Tax=Araneus ventricosus TaxID=182803 RepID=A0A4Y2VEI2_ARAVE|nr:hypothetical protein AVEN_244894-1 [Araneus ventricosus]